MEAPSATEAPAACIFCRPDDPTHNRVIQRSTLSWARWDNHPAGAGHVEILPLRHVESPFDLTPEEITDMWRLLAVVRDTVLTLHRPDGWTIGFNVGRAGGQTIGHAHLHLIPRYDGDVDDPRGGIRNIVPGAPHPGAWLDDDAPAVASP